MPRMRRAVPVGSVRAPCGRPCAGRRGNSRGRGVLSLSRAFGSRGRGSHRRNASRKCGQRSRPSPTPSRGPLPARSCSGRRWRIWTKSGPWRDLDERATALEARVDALAASAAAQAESVDPLDLDRQLRTLASGRCDHRRRSRGNRPAPRARSQRARGGRPKLAGEVAVPGEAARSRDRTRACAIDRGEAAGHERPRPGVPRQRAPGTRPRAGAAGTHRRRARTHRRAAGARPRPASAGAGTPAMATRHGAGPVPARRGGTAFDLAVAAGVPGAGRRRPCRIVLRRPGADLLALHRKSEEADGSAPRALRPTRRRIVAHRADVAVVAGARPAGPVLRGAALPRSDSRRDGGAERPSGTEYR